MERTSNYHYTVKNDDRGHAMIAATRAGIKALNAFRRRHQLGTNRFEVVIRGRLGKDSPYRHLYAVGGPLWIKSVQGSILIQHSERIDVYVRSR